MTVSSFLLSSCLPWLPRLSALALAMAAAGCMIEDRHYDRPSTGAPAPSGTGSVGGSAPDAASSVSPMLVVVDTDQIMNAQPGEGVGIFTEYVSGGHWLVWWTCDTNLSGQDCDVSLAASVATGTLSDVDATDLQGGTYATPTASRVEARATTSTQVHGIKFKTAPGAVITLDATVGGLREGPGPNRSFFFFVQDGKINGGYGGALTNPLQFQGKTP